MSIEHHPTLAAHTHHHAVAPALESLLNHSMLRVDIVAEEQYCGSWFMDEPRYHCGLFHLVGTGECLVESSAFSEALHLEAGDLVVLPHGDPHRLYARNDHEETVTSLICGELHFSSHTQHPLSHALPTCFVVRAAQADAVFRHLTAMMVDVAHSGMPGRKVLLNKLADTLFTLAVCDYAHRNTDHRGLFAALADGRICKVLQAVHENPGQSWTMQSMASLACMSRSAFAERFAQLMKMPPMQYVTQWRVSVAERMLRDKQLSVAWISEQLGYSSEAAFRRLFKRVSGICPGRLRNLNEERVLN
ncbi:AraC family transcriptional regulator [Dyella flava]|uniref:AraC family transcriptional regulator n=1 Tax=Dyella flava TaxID=1920170 RepID=A0ABS2K4G6_9GAMM|nr:AraC family transcriptional regulator [Dyella flava]MBM7126101.1 AraC family transcriptional regulator [Dyella flava]GLQ49094.1 cupin [Dyella flava]